jgi:hypothetical protein
VITSRKNSANGADANAALAYKFWLARCFYEGSPEEDLFRAVCANSGAIKPGASPRPPSPKNGKRN